MKTGYCSICKRPDVKAINNAIKAGLSYNQVKDMLPDPPAKATFAKHKSHVTSPLITDAEAARKSPVLTPRSNKEVLEAIRDIGLANAMENPDRITTNHALRAAAILSEKEQKTDNVKIILAKLLTGPPPVIEAEIIEGDFSLLETTEEGING